MMVRRLWPSGPGSTLFPDVDRLRREMDRLLDSMAGGSPFPTSGVWPPVAVSHDRDNYYVRAEMPGVKPTDLEVTTARAALTLAGKRVFPREEERISFHRREREEGTFRRTVTLPGEFDGNKVEARYVDGVITVTLPKAEAAKPKQIAVKTS